MTTEREIGRREGRLVCLVPFCGRTRKPMCDDDEEWICEYHFAAIPRALRAEYDSAHAAATAADRRKSDDWSIYQRVCDAWEHCKREALNRAT